jgi:hypothetical protein
VLDTAGGGLARGRAGPGLEAAQCRRRRQGSTPVRLGLAALPVRYGPGLEEGPPDPAPDRQVRRVHLLSDALTRGEHLTDLVRVAGTRWTIEACFEATKGETGARPVRRPLLDRLAPARDLRHAGARLPRRPAPGGHRGERRASTSRPSSCPSPCRKCAGCCGASCGRGRPTSSRSWPGPAGDAVISSERDAATGEGEPGQVMLGCKTRAT